MHSPAPYFALLFNAVVWGLSWWPFKTMHAAGLAAPWATSLIYAALVLGTTLLAPRSWAGLLAHPALWLLALSSGLTNVAFNTASSTGDVVRVILLFYLMPAWAVLLAWKFLGERPTPQGLLRLALAFAGMGLVIVPAGASWSSLTAGIALPDYLAVFGGLCFAITNVVLRRTHSAPGTSRMLAMFVGCMATGLTTASLGYGLGALPGLPAPQTTWVLCALVMAVLVAIGNWALQYGAARLPTATTSLIMLSEVLFATVSAWLLGATELTPRMLLGGALIIGGALLAALQGRRRKA
ncbi:DMT family transporter [Comamonas terrigena]|jgi:drug/metabolite transporter (DMT)-like permease|uniref:DMT family transporter n=1 Tax=Comamonas terrigena TaxID=32013 RepID=UPI0024469C4F|nr:DMT family transporter [Comamonas terrigena]MDH0049243.1 DMT family transporter [Comamonas terrigena]MDH0511968.1 DMT family transporter [Comamonas terrigena]MDH1091654.1 DMT family transporter [Comamonas terrigena]MDH1500365.1 DMT family transporter [Comamonas terrigena]